MKLFPPFWEVKTDRPSDQQTDGHGRTNAHREVSLKPSQEDKAIRYHATCVSFTREKFGYIDATAAFEKIQIKCHAFFSHFANFYQVKKRIGLRRFSKGRRQNCTMKIEESFGCILAKPDQVLRKPTNI